jgi:DNA helicase-2/ATP-dependent DNA helicase PcrA
MSAGIVTRRSPTSCHCCSTQPGIAACCAKAALTTEGRLENLQELVQLAGGFRTARELLDHAALSTGGPDEEETGRVQLMTLHVFLPAWEAGVFPPDYGDPAEERQLA